MSTTGAARLDDRYRLEDGVVYLSGIQALVRLPIDQARRDRRSGLRTGTFISGYPGSPLAGYDLALARAKPLLDALDILHVPAANEEMAATAISGTQMLDGYPHSRVDGVVAFWYGKGPGVDRSGDALKHGNFAGTSRHGAVVVLSGDDHEAKSSTLPFQDDYAFQSAGIPILYPASTAEFLTLGLHAVAMSRYSGCWVALKLVNALADGGETLSVSPEQANVVLPELSIDGRPFQKTTDFRFFPGLNVETERRLYYERQPAAIAYARANGLDAIVARSSRDRIGILSAGKSYADVRAALMDMGLDGQDLQRAGIRLLKMGLIYPIDRERVQEFARDLDEIVVVEEKRGFLEAQVKEAVCGLPRAVHVLGKSDESGAPLFRIQGGMDSDMVAERLGLRLLKYLPGHAGIERRLEQLRATCARRYDAHGGRTPNYCSGCPHNISTRLLEGELAWGSPGCHSFASIIEQPSRHVVSMTQLGGEGLPWIGLAPFTDRRHIVQNVGDGSLFHSSYLNIRFCVAAGVNITFKLLYNGSVANTGAQDPVGAKPIPELTRLLELEGVKRIAVLTKDPEAYRESGLAAIARVHPVEEQDAVLEALKTEPGVSVFIYDGLCANERRRRQKRGKAPLPTTFVVINEEVCEGCGHCGALTNCMSLHPVETEFGAKTRIHTSSCAQDMSCLGGDCPSFLTVETEPGTGYARPALADVDPASLPEPVARHDAARPFHIYIPGVGGTGVLTLNALLCQAALLDGKHARSYDQTGAAQKWGAVLSSVLIARDRSDLVTNRVGAGQADLYLACDLLAAAEPANLDRCDPERTAAVINTTVLPSGEMVRQARAAPDAAAMTASILRFSDASRSMSVDARRLAEGLFRDYMATNVFLLGVAYQSGFVPLAAAAIEAAIELNDVQVEQNLRAFRYGRLYAADPRRVLRLVEPGPPTLDDERQRVASALSASEARAYAAQLDRCRDLDDETRRLIAIRIGELIRYQDARYARSYVDRVLSVAERERVKTPGHAPLVTQAFARYLYKLMAYKDEYEVARLHLKPALRQRTRGLFVAPRRVRYHLHPPLLRALGLKRKLRLGPWFTPALRLLRGLKFLRGTPWDVFGYARVRREERRLVGWYEALVASALENLDAQTHARVAEIARVPDRVRGYEEVKLRNVEAARAHAQQLLAGLGAPVDGRRSA
jgi:indolepyruvate ferredoxin oxidoreductase